MENRQSTPVLAGHLASYRRCYLDMDAGTKNIVYVADTVHRLCIPTSAERSRNEGRHKCIQHSVLPSQGTHRILNKGSAADAGSSARPFFSPIPKLLPKAAEETYRSYNKIFHVPDS